MEKINKEELMKKLNLTEEELEKVAGAGTASDRRACYQICHDRFGGEYGEGLTELEIECIQDCDKDRETIPGIM